MFAIYSDSLGKHSEGENNLDYQLKHNAAASPSLFWRHEIMLR